MDIKRINELIDILNQLTDDERVELISNYCTHCGSVDPFCQCWDDE
jgi:hypothetical protein